MQVWKTSFENLLNRNDDNINLTQEQHSNVQSNYFETEIEISEVQAAVKTLKCNKAVGIDELPAEVLKCDNLFATLCALSNKCFITSIIPSAWKQGIINPIPTSTTSDRRDTLNYRGFTLTSAVYKLFCIILNKRLSKWGNENLILADNQNGFRKHRSTTDHIISLTSIIETETRKLYKKDVFAAFIDFTKAYDNIDRGILFTKLSDLVISGLMYKALIAIYDNVRCLVRINGRFTEWFDVSCCLKQGCSLSSTLFNLIYQRFNC